MRRVLSPLAGVALAMAAARAMSPAQAAAAREHRRAARVMGVDTAAGDASPAADEPTPKISFDPDPIAQRFGVSVDQALEHMGRLYQPTSSDLERAFTAAARRAQRAQKRLKMESK